jgi:hypothetical protein
MGEAPRIAASNQSNHDIQALPILTITLRMLTSVHDLCVDQIEETVDYDREHEKD